MTEPQCQHQWEAWRRTCQWKASDALGSQNAWLRDCPKCGWSEYVSMRDTEEPSNSDEIKGWLMPPS